MSNTDTASAAEITAAIIRHCEWLDAETLPTFRRQHEASIARLARRLAAK